MATPNRDELLKLIGPEHRHVLMRSLKPSLVGMTNGAKKRKAHALAVAEILGKWLDQHPFTSPGWRRKLKRNWPVALGIALSQRYRMARWILGLKIRI